jgi:1,4-dihydroxy-2-naphthoyl-CoA hydrolase
LTRQSIISETFLATFLAKIIPGVQSPSREFPDSTIRRTGRIVMTPLEKVNSMKMPFAELKGVTFTDAGKDRVVARMLVRPDLCTLGHTIHGGAIMAFADSVGAAATVINLPEDAKGTTTIESKTNFIGGAREGTTLVATATPVHRGRRTQVWQTRLETEDGKLVAVVTQTQMVLV